MDSAFGANRPEFVRETSDRFTVIVNLDARSRIPPPDAGPSCSNHRVGMAVSIRSSRSGRNELSPRNGTP